MREKVKKLWKLCFNDNDEFVDMYFNLRYNSEVNVAIESGDEVIAALQMLPYPITFMAIAYRLHIFRAHALPRLP